MKLTKVTFHETQGVHVDGLGTIRVASEAAGHGLELTALGLIISHPSIPGSGRSFVPMHKLESGLLEMLPSVSEHPDTPLPEKRGAARSRSLCART